MFQSFKFQVCLLVQKGPKFHNIGTNNVNCTYSRVRPSINIKDKVWQTVFVSDILQACMQMSAISFFAYEKVEKGNFSACKKGNRRCEPRLPWAAMVGRIQPDKRQHTNYLYFIF